MASALAKATSFGAEDGPATGVESDGAGATSDGRLRLPVAREGTIGAISAS